MRAVLLDFNGTMFFDSSLHVEAWSKIFMELHPEHTGSIDTSLFCGGCNDDVLKCIAPWLDSDQRDGYSERKEELYRHSCKNNPEIVHLVKGTEAFLQYLQDHRIPFALASASIKSNVDFYFETFALGRWFNKEDVVYDDGTYPDKGAMHLEAAKRLQIDFAQCLLIEDSLSAVRLAKQNGAGCIVAIGSTAPRAQLLLTGADYHIADFSEFDYGWLEQSNPITI